MSLKSQNITRNKKIQEKEPPEDLIIEIKIEAKEAEDWELVSEVMLIEETEISIKIEKGKTMIIKEDLIVKDLDTQKLILMIRIILKKLIVTQEMIKVRKEIPEVEEEEEEEDLEEQEAIEEEIDLKVKDIDPKIDNREVGTTMEDQILPDLNTMVKDPQEEEEVKEAQAEDQEVAPNNDHKFF